MPPLDIAAYCAQGGSVPLEHQWYCRQLVERCAYAEGERLCSAAYGYGTPRFVRCRETLAGSLWTHAADPRVRNLLSRGAAHLSLPGCNGARQRFASAAHCAIGARRIAARCAPRRPTIAPPWEGVLDPGQDRELGYLRLRPRIAHRLLRVRTPLVLLIGTRRESCSRCRQWLSALTRLRAQGDVPHDILSLEWEAFSDDERMAFFRAAQLPIEKRAGTISLRLPMLFARDGERFERIESPRALLSHAGPATSPAAGGRKTAASSSSTAVADENRWRTVSIDQFDVQLIRAGDGCRVLIGTPEAATRARLTSLSESGGALLFLQVEAREGRRLIRFSLQRGIPLELDAQGTPPLPQLFRYSGGRFLKR